MTAPHSILLDGQWRDWLTEPPPRGVVIQIQRFDGIPVTLLRDEVHYCFNVANVFWRLTAIGRWQLGERM